MFQSLAHSRPPKPVPLWLAHSFLRPFLVSFFSVVSLCSPGRLHGFLLAMLLGGSPDPGAEGHFSASLTGLAGSLAQANLGTTGHTNFPCLGFWTLDRTHTKAPCKRKSTPCQQKGLAVAVAVNCTATISVLALVKLP